MEMALPNFYARWIGGHVVLAVIVHREPRDERDDDGGTKRVRWCATNMAVERSLIFGPVLVQAALTALIYVQLAVVKAAALKAGEVDLDRRPLHADAWPESVLKVSNNLRNQFELPVVFYAVAFVLWAQAEVNLATVALAWVFCVSRFVHAYLHTGSNVVALRLRAFQVGILAVLGLLIFAAKSMF